jgi:hypothetical protein
MQHGQLKPTSAQEGDTPDYVSLIVTAERELGAFVRAVTDLFGAEQAELSAEEWVAALESWEASVDLGISDFRRITLKAAAGLAYRKLPETERGDPLERCA